jgi:hypothetical protein
MSASPRIQHKELMRKATIDQVTSMRGLLATSDAKRECADREWLRV